MGETPQRASKPADPVPTDSLEATASRSEGGRWTWRTTAACILALSFTTMSYWAVHNPFPVHWDNALYLNDCRRDLHALRSGGLQGLGSSLLHSNPWRPPAHRVLALVATPLFGADMSSLRAVSLLAWAAALWFLWRGVSSVAGEAAGLLTVMLLAVSPVVTGAVRIFGTESALYLAVAATFSLLLRGIASPKPSPRAWIGLGLALGVGLLAKLSFPWIVGGPMAWCLLLAWRGRLRGLTAAHLIQASGLGLVVAVPWYAVNLRPALEMALTSKNAARYSLGEPSWGVFAAWLDSIRRSGLGNAATLCCTMLILAIVVSWVTGRLPPRPASTTLAIRTALVACALGVVPFAAGQFLASSNHDVRILSPVFLPLLAGVAIATAPASWLSQSPAALGVAFVLAWQAYATLVPVARRRQDHWDWEPLHRLISSRGLLSPRIAYIGSSLQYNPEQLAVPWVERDQPANIDWLWRPESGPIRWGRVLKRLELADIVLVPPSFRGDKLFVLDNSHNAELARRLREDPRFAPPQVLIMGHQRPVDLLVFFRRERTR